MIELIITWRGLNRLNLLYLYHSLLLRTLAGTSSATLLCDVNEAPVWDAIKSSQIKVDGNPYQWMSTYSFRGWCETWCPVDCSGANTGEWADCMTSPYEEVENLAEPDRPIDLSV